MIYMLELQIPNITLSVLDDSIYSETTTGLYSTFVRSYLQIRRRTTGVSQTSPLPTFKMSLRTSIPSTPRVISPSPTPSEQSDQKSYFGPVTRSAKRQSMVAQRPIDEGVEGIDEDEDAERETTELRRARTRSRSPVKASRSHDLKLTSSQDAMSRATLRSKSKSKSTMSNGQAQKSDNHLSPPQSAVGGWGWRALSRSPSPLGLIPIHRHWRSFVHRHEVPRKMLHVSIGFLAVWMYTSGIQTTSTTPYLMGALIPIATVDFLRHTYPALNRCYVRYLGAFMRETEYNGYNGVIWYLLGVWIVMGFFPKDIGMMGVLLLSWCDTAASTIGRAYGAYTPRIRKGKSLAGSLAAFTVGVATAVGFWGWLAPKYGARVDGTQWPFMYTGTLRIPQVLTDALAVSGRQLSISGPLALGVLSLWTGFVAAGSEVIDLFGWDDNLTIPVLSGLGLWAFLKVLG